MRAKFIREARRLIRDYNKATRKTVLRVEVIPVGTVVEHPMAYKLCLQGRAVPDDRECRSRVNMTDSEIEAASNAYDKIAKGIAREDYDAYDRGLMDGYKPDGEKGDTWKPGPNWTEGCEAEYYSDDEDDDEDD